MNTKPLANLYSQLSAEERFRLIVAASDRGDTDERERLQNASERITFSNVDYSPYAQALQELATVELLVLMEDAAEFDDAFERWHDADTMDTTGGETHALSPAEEEAETVKDRLFQVFLAEGFTLRRNAAGWKLFCARMGFAPFSLWHHLPGFKRLQRHLKNVEGTPDRPGPAFTPEGMTRWLNRNRPDGKPEVTEANLLSAERIADGLAAGFRARVEWYGG